VRRLNATEVYTEKMTPLWHPDQALLKLDLQLESKRTYPEITCKVPTWTRCNGAMCCGKTLGPHRTQKLLFLLDEMAGSPPTAIRNDQMRRFAKVYACPEHHPTKLMVAELEWRFQEAREKYEGELCRGAMRTLERLRSRLLQELGLETGVSVRRRRKYNDTEICNAVRALALGRSKDHNQSIQWFKRRLSRAEKEKTVSEARVAAASAEAERLEDTIRTLEKDLRDAQTESQRQQQDLRDLEDEVDHLDRALRTSHDKSRRLEQELVAYKAASEQLQATLRDTQAKNPRPEVALSRTQARRKNPAQN
jgi:hypothetical protein